MIQYAIIKHEQTIVSYVDGEEYAKSVMEVYNREEGDDGIWFEAVPVKTL